MAQAAESDEALIAAYARGEPAAFELLYRRYELRVFRYLLRNTGNRGSADELMQEVWFAVARDAQRYEARSKFAAWLFTIARNRLIDSLRAARPYLSLDAVGAEATPVVQQLTSDPGVAPLAQTLRREERLALDAALAQLPHEQRDAFLLHVEGDLSVEEVATITHSSFETTKSRLRYARARLRELLSEYA